MRETRQGKRTVVAGLALVTVGLLAMTTAARAGVGQAQKPKGTPIRVMTIGTTGTAAVEAAAIEQVARAYEGFINARGGINHRPLDVVYCDDQNNPNVAEQCAREAVSANVAAVIGGFSIVGSDRILAVLEQANIPWLGGGVFGRTMLTSRAAFPTIGGPATEWVAVGNLAAKRGCKTAGQMRWASPAGIVAMDWFRHGLESGGGTVGPVAAVPTEATDLAPAVAVATKGVQCVAMGMSPQQGPLAVQAIKQSGAKVTLAFYPDAIPESAIKQTGGKDSPAEGGLATSWFPAANEKVWNEAKSAIKKYAPKPEVVEFTDTFRFQITWVAYKAFTNAVKGLTTIDGPSVAAALATKDVETGGLTPTLQFRTSAMPGNPAYTRLFNPFVTYLTVKNGKYTSLEKGFKDTTSLLKTYVPSPGLFS